MCAVESKRGKTAMQVYAHLTSHPPGQAWGSMGATRRAAQAGILMSRIAGHSRLSQTAIQDFAKLCQIDELELATQILPALVAEDVVASGSNSASGVEYEERVGVGAPLLTVVGRLLPRFRASPIEICALDSAELAATSPLTARDHRDQLASLGHGESLHERAIALMTSIGVLGRVFSGTLNDHVLYSPHVWGAEAVDIAGFMRSLPSVEREQLTSLTRAASSRPGLPVNNMGIPDNLMAGARKVGLVAGARVHAGGTQRLFAFPADLDRRVFGGRPDVAHQRKLFTAHILNGHFFAPPSRGRIDDPVLLVERLIERGSVGPATSIGQEYPLLESAGIVRTRHAWGDRRYLDLVQTDVARDSLKLIKAALENEPAGQNSTGLGSLLLPGGFKGPEQDRAALDVSQASAEMELMEGAVLDLREHLRRRARGEDLA